MNRGKLTRQNKMNIIIFCAGFIAVLFMGLPYLVLGMDSIVTYHDQLDGELIAYLLNAGHLWDGTLEEFMGGAYKTALIPPAPAFVLLFVSGDGFGGLVCMQMLGSICGYVGMYLLVRQIAENAEIAMHKSMVAAVAAIIGVLYAYLPFLPVYGLAQYGLPMLLWCVLELQKGRHASVAYCYALLYALTSSLVLVGFAVLGVLLVWIVWNGIRRSASGVPVRKLLLMWTMLLLVYVAENLSLLCQTLGIGALGEVLSHKAEYVLYPTGMLEGFVRNITRGGQHSEDFHNLFWVAVLVVMLLGAVCKGNQKLLKIMCTFLSVSVCIAFVAALWDGALGITLRTELQALGAFQLNRLLWLSPCLWYCMLGCALLLVSELVMTSKGRKRMASLLGSVLLLAVLGITGGKVLLESNLKPNIQKMRNSDYAAMSFRDYYAIGVLEQVGRYILETTGEEKDEYYVVSLGIDPAAALYHGFYCLDGYSNNYSLEYKHAFRRVIAPELAKNAYLEENFDGWGNRCYLFSAECPGYYTIEKDGFYFQDYSLDVEALKDLGGKYVFSAAYIQNAEEMGLTLLRENPFETQDSYYQIYLYEVS